MIEPAPMHSSSRSKSGNARASVTSNLFVLMRSSKAVHRTSAGH